MTPCERVAPAEGCRRLPEGMSPRPRAGRSVREGKAVSRTKTKAARALACAALACMLAAPMASPYPDAYGPFEGKRPAVFRTYCCRLVETGEKEAARPLIYARGDGRNPSARVRLSRDEETGAILMTVLDPDGRVLAGPQRIAEGAVVIPPAFWADLNGDGREDFVALVVTALGGSACVCDIGFALSSETGYRITSVRSTRGPGANDFLDLGAGRVGFIHTALVERRDPANPEGAPESFFVYSMLEVKGDKLALAEADPRFPKWVRVAARAKKAPDSTLAEDEKKRLWSEVAGRILRKPENGRPPEVASVQQ